MKLDNIFPKEPLSIFVFGYVFGVLGMLLVNNIAIYFVGAMIFMVWVIYKIK